MTDANVLLTDVATVSEADLREVSQRLGLTIKEEETEDYLKLMGQFKQSLDMVMSFPGMYLVVVALSRCLRRPADHLPPVDYDVFPRYNIRVPPDAENALKGWATKVSVSGRRGGCLEGKTICLKDNICLAGVPCQFGTDVVSDFVRAYPPLKCCRLASHDRRSQHGRHYRDAHP